MGCDQRSQSKELVRCDARDVRALHVLNSGIERKLLLAAMRIGAQFERIDSIVYRFRRRQSLLLLLLFVVVII